MSVLLLFTTKLSPVVIGVFLCSALLWEMIPKKDKTGTRLVGGDTVYAYHVQFLVVTIIKLQNIIIILVG